MIWVAADGFSLSSLSIVTPCSVSSSWTVAAVVVTSDFLPATLKVMSFGVVTDTARPVRGRLVERDSDSFAPSSSRARNSVRASSRLVAVVKKLTGSPSTLRVTCLEYSTVMTWPSATESLRAG